MMHLTHPQQAPRPQHALDRVGRGLDLVALGALGGGDQPLDRDFKHAPACDGRGPLGKTFAASRSVASLVPSSSVIRRASLRS